MTIVTTVHYFGNIFYSCTIQLYVILTLFCRLSVYYYVDKYMCQGGVVVTNTHNIFKWRMRDVHDTNDCENNGNVGYEGVQCQKL